jgi:hypothetical protein
MRVVARLKKMAARWSGHWSLRMSLADVLVRRLVRSRVVTASVVAEIIGIEIRDILIFLGIVRRLVEQAEA